VSTEVSTIMLLIDCIDPVGCNVMAQLHLTRTSLTRITMSTQFSTFLEKQHPYF